MHDEMKTRTRVTTCDSKTVYIESSLLAYKHMYWHSNTKVDEKKKQPTTTKNNQKT
jgi:hypothetical protein